MIASKIEDVHAPTMHDFVKESYGAFNAQQMKEMEVAVCFALKFELQSSPVFKTSNELLLCRSEKTKSSPTIDTHMQLMVEYLLVLSRMTIHLTHVPHKLTAEAVLYLARATLRSANTHTRPVGRLPEDTHCCSTSNPDTFAHVVETLISEHHLAAINKHTTYTQYSRHKFKEISLIPHLNESDPHLAQLWAWTQKSYQKKKS
jgi:hypothetical protein